MRKFLLRIASVVVALLTMGACADSPTAVDRQQPLPAFADLALQDQQLAGCVRDGVCVLPPLIVVGRCDPWMSLDWCGDGQNCIESVPGSPDGQYQGTLSCPIGGGGGGGGSGGPGGGLPPGGGTPPPSGPGDCPTAAEVMCPVEPIDPDTCATNDPVVDNPVVEAAFAQLWANSNPDASQAQRREQAAWIVKTATGALEIVPFTNADFGPCTITPRMGSFSIPSNAVGWIHTHPFSDGEVQNSCPPIIGVNGTPRHGAYDGFPNSDDMSIAALFNQNLGRNIDTYYIDRVRIVRFVATSPNTVTSISRYGRCGY